ncbi:hypothetical protein PCASD_00975 [Puccinia coronata f. sp. avenae]|uniref:Uncharacterized protein n=1 Tax=Puccinia coronata f. sp. avenae TaxID=200324 RepID=A0A2N5VMY5_9BASI|nr:hypothetical protein PCASD_00975 [Puccinia coronata f. sp. avenae]
MAYHATYKKYPCQKVSHDCPQSSVVLSPIKPQQLLLARLNTQLLDSAPQGQPPPTSCSQVTQDIYPICIGIASSA